MGLRSSCVGRSTTCLSIPSTKRSRIALRNLARLRKMGQELEPSPVAIHQHINSVSLNKHAQRIEDRQRWGGWTSFNIRMCVLPDASCYHASQQHHHCQPPYRWRRSSPLVTGSFVAWTDEVVQHFCHLSRWWNIGPSSQFCYNCKSRKTTNESSIHLLVGKFFIACLLGAWTSIVLEPHQHWIQIVRISSLLAGSPWLIDFCKRNVSQHMWQHPG